MPRWREERGETSLEAQSGIFPAERERLKLDYLQLRANYEAQRRLREYAERRLKEVEGAVKELARALAAPELTAYAAEGGDPEEWDVLEWIEFTREKVKARINRLTLLGGGKERIGKLEEQAREIEGLKAELAAARARAARLEERVKEFKAELAAQKRIIEELVAERRMRERPEMERITPPPGYEWMSNWQREAGEAFPKQIAVMKVIGFKGLCRRPKVVEAAGLNPGSGTERRVIDALLGKVDYIPVPLIEKMEPKSETTGRAPWLVRFTEEGEEVFKILFGIEPVVSELTKLLKRHLTPEHVLLNLEFADEARLRGWEVDLFPDPIPLPDGGMVYPDQVITKDGEEFYVECERSTAKKPEDRAIKWANLLQATGGKICVVTPDKRSQSAIFSEITQWAHGKHRVHFYATNVAALKQDETKELWVVRNREIR